MKTKLFNKYENVREMLMNESPSTLTKLFPHGRPQNRRDLLKAGAIGFAASMTPTSLLELLLPAEAHAQALPACGAQPTFIGLKLNGGAAMLGNPVVLGANRDYISIYNQLGLGTKSEIMNRTVTVFGNAKFYDASQMLAGIRQEATATTLLNTSFVAIPVASTDDSANNPFDITHFVSKLGIAGKILPNLGRRQSLTGIGQMPALGRTPPTPLAIGQVSDLSDALTVRGSLQALNESQKAEVFKLIQNLSESQVRKIASDSGGTVLAQLVDQATQTNASLVGNSSAGIDPLQDNTVSTAFNTLWQAGNTNMNQQGTNSQPRVFGTMVYNSLKGNAGTTNLELGGFDYHGQGRAQQDTKDLEAGVNIGRILESAAIMQKPVFIMVTSDGAVGAAAGSPAGAPFTSDRGQGGAIHIYAYHPVARPASVNKSGIVDHQIGQVRGQAAVDTDFLTGNDPSLAGLAAFVNFASFSGLSGQVPNVIGGVWNSDAIDLVTRLRRVG